jgi:hypothetical protein
MCTINGFIQSSDQIYTGVGTTSLFPWLLATSGDTIRIVQKRTVEADSKGLPGEICWDENFIYICVGENKWKGIVLA